MSDDREFLRATTEWLEAGSDRTPPKAVDAVLLAVRTTRQDRVLPNPWRQFDMNALAKALVAATAVVAIALAWYNFGPSGNSVGVLPAPDAHPQPHANALATPTPAVLRDGDPGVARARPRTPSRVDGTNPKISFTVPSGWTGNSRLVGKDYGDSGPAAPYPVRLAL